MEAAQGFRTFGAIAVGSCLFGLISQNVGGVADIARIASQVVVGVGFLGAGVIFRQGDYVAGLTTAATLWGTAAVGLGDFIWFLSTGFFIRGHYFPFVVFNANALVGELY